MSRATEYRDKASEYIARAAQASDLSARVMYLQLAGVWTNVANTIERNESRRPDVDVAA